MNDDLKSELKERRAKIIRRNLRQAKWSRRWVYMVVTGLFIYVALPILAPTLMAVGATGPGNLLYTVYSPMCHQFAFRSFFLYGEQAVYPREAVGKDIESFDQRAARSEKFVEIFEDNRRKELINAGMSSVAEGYTFSGPEELEEWTATLQRSARAFRGDDQMGYKIAVCERDISIYAAMVVGGIAFIFVRKRLRPVPLLLYAILGLGPIGIDGFSQLLSYPPFEFWAVRETLPEFRVLTGALFGLMNVWLAFPYLERSMIDNAQELERTAAEMQAEQEV